MAAYLQPTSKPAAMADNELWSPQSEGGGVMISADNDPNVLSRFSSFESDDLNPFSPPMAPDSTDDSDDDLAVFCPVFCPPADPDTPHCLLYDDGFQNFVEQFNQEPASSAEGKSPGQHGGWVSKFTEVERFEMLNPNTPAFVRPINVLAVGGSDLTPSEDNNIAVPESERERRHHRNLQALYDDYWGMVWRRNRRNQYNTPGSPLAGRSGLSKVLDEMPLNEDLAYKFLDFDPSTPPVMDMSTRNLRRFENRPAPPSETESDDSDPFA